MDNLFSTLSCHIYPTFVKLPKRFAYWPLNSTVFEALVTVSSLVILLPCHCTRVYKTFQRCLDSRSPIQIGNINSWPRSIWTHILRMKKVYYLFSLKTKRLTCYGLYVSCGCDIKIIVAVFSRAFPYWGTTVWSRLARGLLPASFNKPTSALWRKKCF